MAIVETKLFNNATLNSNTSIEYQQPNDLLGGLNVRTTAGEENKEGLVVTLEGTREIVRTLPSGTNTVVGAKYFDSVNKAYIFTHNSSGLHSLVEFDPLTESFINIYEELTDSSGVAILNLTPDERIKDIVLIDDEFIVFTIFPRDEVKMLSLPLAKGGSYSPFRILDFDLGTYPTPDRPDASYYNSGDFVTGSAYNNLKGKLFQFRYRYKYIDGRYSDYSAISERPTPTSEMDDQGNIEQQDIIGLGLDVLDARVAEVEISARDGANDWYTILTKDRQWFNDLPLFTAGEILDPPNPPIFVFRFDIPQRYSLGGGYYIPFRNEGLYPQDNQLEHDLIASAIPTHTRAIEFVNGTNLLLANNQNGYPRPDMTGQFSADLSLLPSPISEPDDPDAFRAMAWHRTPGEDYMREEVVFEGSPAIGDTIIGIFRRTGIPTDVEISYAVTSSEAGDPYAALQEWVDLLVAEFGTTAIRNAQVITTAQEGLPAIVFQRRYASISYMSAMRVELSGSVNELNISEGIIKTGSSYSLIPTYYDYLGRPIPLPKGTEVTIETPTMAESEGMVPAISWNLTGAAPANAAKYTIAVSYNRTHADNWSVVARVDPDSTPDVYHFDITSLYIFNRDRQGAPPSYDFASGDLVHIISNVDSTSGIRSDWVNNPVRVFDVMSLTPVVLEDDDPLYDAYPEHTKWILKTQRPTNDQFDPDEPVLLEIYRPVKSNEDQKIFFEVGLPMYDVVGGQHSVESGTITKLDSFIKLRRVTLPWEELNPNVDVVVESFHFSDNYISNHYSYGRPRSYNDTPEGLWNHGEIRWSDLYVRDTEIKNHSRFYPENVYQVDHTYGGIQKLHNRENRLICLQEDKVGYIPVYRTIIMDNAGLQQIATSEKLLNPVNYYAGANIGVGKEQFVLATEFVNGNLYFIDGNRLDVARSGIDGTRLVANRYSGALKDKLRECLDNNYRPLMVFDERFGELLLIFQDHSWVYSEVASGFVPKRDYLPEGGFSANERLYTLKDGALYIHDDEVNRNVFYGTAYPAEIDFAITSPGVKNYQSMEIHSDKLILTADMGISTQLGQESELNQEDDFTYNGEGTYTANFLRDNNSPGGIISGDRLKGRWIRLHLYVPEGGVEPIGQLNLLKVVTKSSVSNHNFT